VKTPSRGGTSVKMRMVSIQKHYFIKSINIVILVRIP
jgi:hypothetical protein